MEIWQKKSDPPGENLQKWSYILSALDKNVDFLCKKHRFSRKNRHFGHFVAYWRVVNSFW